MALFATPATVASRAFQRELAFRAIGVSMSRRKACGGVVDAIEDGDMILAEALVRSAMWTRSNARCRNPQAAILGCTHYPLMEAEFQAALGPDGVKVFSQGNIGGRQLWPITLRRHPDMLGEGARPCYLTTGRSRPRSAIRATQFLRRRMTFTAA